MLGVEKVISIPSGAIKSLELMKTATSESEFQFLLVRLKESERFKKFRLNSYFNSFWCD